MDKIKRLFFDIETRTNPEAIPFIKDPTPPGNYKDPATIAKWVEEKRAELISKAPLDEDLCQVVAISMQIKPGGRSIVHLVGDKQTPNEKFLIKEFWKKLAETEGRCVGFNIIAYDFPVLLRRSMELDIKVPVMPHLAKYHVEPVTDLFGIIHQWQPGKGLKWLCERYGISVLLPGVDGSMVAEMDDETLRQYAASDLDALVRLYHKMNGVYYNL